MITQPLASIKIWIETTWPTVKACLQHQTEKIRRQNWQLEELFTKRNNDKEGATNTNQSQGEEHEISTEENERIVIFETEQSLTVSPTTFTTTIRAQHDIPGQ